MEPLSTVGRVFDVLGTQIETQVSKYAGFDISTFVWTSKSWLASTETVLITAVVYLLLTYLGVKAMEPYKKFEAVLASQLHNFFMFAMSGAFFIVSSVETARLYYHKGMSEAFCPSPEGPEDSTSPTGTLMYYCYLFYLSKFYELFETILLVIKKRDMSDFRSKLHIFHHAIVPLTISVSVWGNWTMPLYAGTVWNSGVHTIMYLYFFLRSVNIEPRWKVLVTYSQIIQFVNGGIYAFVYFILYLKNIHMTTPGDINSLTYTKGCAGDLTMMTAAASIDITFLVLFIILFGKTYGPKTKRSSKAKAE